MQSALCTVRSALSTVHYVCYHYGVLSALCCGLDKIMVLLYYTVQ